MLEKHQVLAWNACFGGHKHGSKCSKVSLKVSSDYMLTDVETQSWTVVTGLAAFSFCANGKLAYDTNKCGGISVFSFHWLFPVIFMQCLTTVRLNNSVCKNIFILGSHCSCCNSKNNFRFRQPICFSVQIITNSDARFQCENSEWKRLKKATQTVLFSQSLHNLNFWSYDYCFVVFSAPWTITAGTWQLENISGGCQEVHSGVHCIEIGGLCVCVCVF